MEFDVDVTLLNLEIIAPLEGGQVLVLTLNVHIDVLIQINDSLLLRQVTAAPARRHLALHLNINGIFNRLLRYRLLFTLRVPCRAPFRPLSGSFIFVIVAHGLCH